MRKDGYYWIKIKGYGWENDNYNQWIIGFYSSYAEQWSIAHSNLSYKDKHLDEINELRIEI